MAGVDLVNRVLFPCPAATYGLFDSPEELVFIPRGLALEGSRPEECMPALLLIARSARFTVLYFHSNAEDLGRCYPFCTLLKNQFHVNVLVVEYPGYGLCPGRPTEASAVENGFLAMRFITQVLKVPEEDVIIMGRSIGCGLATSIAAKYRVHGLILICPFVSVREVFREYIGSAADMLQERFPNNKNIRRVRSPTMIVHGKADTIVPWTHGLRLFELCRARKKLVVPEAMRHNTSLHADPAYFVLPMLSFFGLPDYRFDEIEVPDWIFDKRLSTFFADEEDDGMQDACVRCVRGSGFRQPLHCEVSRPSWKEVGAVSVTSQQSFGPTPSKVRVDPALPQRSATAQDVPPWGGDASDTAMPDDDGDRSGLSEDQDGIRPDTGLPIGNDDASADLLQERAIKQTISTLVSVLGQEPQAESPRLFAAAGQLQPTDAESQEELPEAPDDLGFFKVPRSRDVGGLLTARPGVPRALQSPGVAAATAAALGQSAKAALEGGCCPTGTAAGAPPSAAAAGLCGWPPHSASPVLQPKAAASHADHAAAEVIPAPGGSVGTSPSDGTPAVAESSLLGRRGRRPVIAHI